MQGEVREIAVDIVCADGGRLPALINSVLSKDAAGQPLLDPHHRLRRHRPQGVRARAAARAAEGRAGGQGQGGFHLDDQPRDPHPAQRDHGRSATSSAMTELCRRSSRSSSGILRSSSENLLDLVNDILDFSKIEAGKVVPGGEELRPPASWSTGSSTASRLKAEEKGLALDASRSTSGCRRASSGIRSRSGRCSPTWWAMPSSSPQQGSVTRAAPGAGARPRRPPSIQFRVTDTGIGIAAGPAAARLRRLHPGQLRHRPEVRRHRPRPRRSARSWWSCTAARSPSRASPGGARRSPSILRLKARPPRRARRRRRPRPSGGRRWQA